MPCTTLETITKGCENNTGGISSIYFFDMEDVASITEDDATWLITELDITPDGGTTPTPPIGYDLTRYTSNYVEDVAAEFTNGNNTNNVTITLRFNRREAEKSRSIKILGEGQRYLGALIKDQNGLYWLIKDARLSAVAEGSGTARADGSHYNVTFIAEVENLSKGIAEADAETFITDGYFTV